MAEITYQRLDSSHHDTFIQMHINQLREERVDENIDLTQYFLRTRNILEPKILA